MAFVITSYSIHYTKLYDEAVRVIHESSEMKKPFFMYLAYNAPHVPLQAKEEDIAHFSNIKDQDRRNNFV